MCGGAALDMFSAGDLELLICGNPLLDFEALKAGTRYAMDTLTYHVSVGYIDA